MLSLGWKGLSYYCGDVVDLSSILHAMCVSALEVHSHGLAFGDKSLERYIQRQVEATPSGMMLVG